MKPAFAFFAAFMALFALPAEAQEPKANCKNPQTQIEMNICSQRDYDAADKALNAQYQTTRKAMKAWDADAMSELKGAEDALVKAQRAWVAYRDAQCISTGFQAHGGSMEPMLISGCQADLTRKRTAELKELTEAMGN
ncbi:Probable urease-associated protein [Neorhizobium galegae bv. orientalis]|nr:Probable urease-associated protein [Neorhizobium galegae bv. orientalis]